MGRCPIALCAVALLVSGCGGRDDEPAQGGIPEAQGTLLGNVGTSYYDDPNRLITAPIDQPRAGISVSGNVLTITRDLDWVSAIEVMATAGDGRGGTDSKTFRVTVT